MNKGLKVNRGEDMDSLYESMEYDFENGAGIIDNLKESYAGYRDWETGSKCFSIFDS